MTRWFILVTLLAMPTLARGNCQPRSIPGLTMIDLPIALKTMNGAMITKLQCHRSMAGPLTSALECVKLKGLVWELRNTGGCYCYRNVAGTDRLSKHAYGTAIDLNVGKSIHPSIVECFESSGFEWGGRWPHPDFMHFQLRKTK